MFWQWYLFSYFITLLIKFVSHLRQVGGFLLVLRFSSTNKTDRYDITEILLKMELNTVNLNLHF